MGARGAGELPEHGYAHFDEHGELVDTLGTPPFDNPPPGSVGSSLSPSLEWGISRQGDLVVGANDRYAFEVRKKDGGVLRVIREVPIVPLNPEERAEHEARRSWTIEHEAQFFPVLPPPVPDFKPFFRDFYFGDDGTIWVHRFVEAEKVSPPDVDSGAGGRPPLTWREPIVFDVFEPDGAYLGEVRVPPRTNPMVFHRERVWGLQAGEFGETYVVRFRLSHPGVDEG